MNSLFLGDETPDYNHEVLQKFKQFKHPGRQLTEEERLIFFVQTIRSDSFDPDQDRLDLYYREKLLRLKEIFDLQLKLFGNLELPAKGLSVWVRLLKARNFSTCIPGLKDLGVYNPSKNCAFDQKKVVTRMRLGFGQTTLDTYQLVFLILKEHFKINSA